MASPEAQPPAAHTQEKENYLLPRLPPNPGNLKRRTPRSFSGLYLPIRKHKLSTSEPPEHPPLLRALSWAETSSWSAA